MIAEANSLPVTTRVRIARRALTVLVWGFLALLLVQVYLAGLFLMGGINAFPAHEGLGWTLTNYVFLTLIAGLFARMPRAFWLSLLALLVAVHVQPFLTLASSSDGLGWVRALHPLNAVLLVGLAAYQLWVVRHVRRA